MESKPITSRNVAMAFTGSLLGAGFVSGQELMQFFGVFGRFGIMGMVFSIMMFFVLGCLVMKIATKTGITSFDKIIVRKEIPWLRAFFGSVFVFFLFGIVVIMIAGTGALLHQMFGLPPIMGKVFMALVLGVVAMWEVRGVLTAFGITVPLLILVAVVTGILSFFLLDATTITSQPSAGVNPLLGNWVISTVAFVSYNMMAAISILVPIAKDITEETTIHKGMLQGAGQLALIFLCILLPLILHHDVLASQDLPMLSLATLLHPVLGLVYAALLFCGMFGSALSCLFGVSYRIKQAKRVKTQRLIPLLVIIAFLGSIVGFKELISILLPLCGYVGFFAMIGIVLHYSALPQSNRVDGKSIDVEQVKLPL